MIVDKKQTQQVTILLIFVNLSFRIFADKKSLSSLHMENFYLNLWKLFKHNKLRNSCVKLIRILKILLTLDVILLYFLTYIVLKYNQDQYFSNLNKFKFFMQFVYLNIANKDIFRVISTNRLSEF